MMNKKGFTLVEVIVVLVILAILAAVLIPTLTGYIDKANERVVVSECRSAVMAAQTLASEAYGTKEALSTAVTTAKIEALAELAAGTVSGIAYDTANDHKIVTLVYTSNGYVCTYNGSAANAGTKFTVTQP
ncbi:MAG: prepilin-type N-terminal cleavage/methylation domain-containing protein [Clostridiales bacterium]